MENVEQLENPTFESWEKLENMLAQIEKLGGSVTGMLACCMHSGAARAPILFPTATAIATASAIATVIATAIAIASWRRDWARVWQLPHPTEKKL